MQSKGLESISLPFRRRPRPLQPALNEFPDDPSTRLRPRPRPRHPRAAKRFTVTAAIMGSAPVPNFDDVGEKVLSPSMLAHVVLRTGNFSKMVEFYSAFLGGAVTHGNEFLSFITYDQEHHRIALIDVPGTGPKTPTAPD